MRGPEDQRREAEQERERRRLEDLGKRSPAELQRLIQISRRAVRETALVTPCCRAVPTLADGLLACPSCVGRYALADLVPGKVRYERDSEDEPS